MALDILEGVDAIESVVDPLERRRRRKNPRSVNDAMIPQFEDPELRAHGEHLRWKSDIVGFGVSVSVERDSFDPSSYGGEEERDRRERRRAWVDLGGEGEGEMGEKREVLTGLKVEKRWEGKMIAVVEVVAADLEGSKGRRESQVSGSDVSPPYSQLLELLEERRIQYFRQLRILDGEDGSEPSQSVRGSESEGSEERPGESWEGALDEGRRGEEDVDELSSKAGHLWVVDLDLGMVPSEPCEGSDVVERGGRRIEEEREEEGGVTRIREMDVAIEERGDHELKKIG